MEEILAQLKTTFLNMKDKWAEDLSRKFLPKWAKSTSSQTVHATQMTRNFERAKGWLHEAL